MKKLRTLLATSLLILPTLALAQSPEPSRPADQARPNDELIVAWLRKNAVPLESVKAGSGFADLAPMKKVLSSARVVGLGESTHGTSEFQQLKHRMLEFLVTQMGFTAFTIEAAYSDCKPVNDYVLHGTGDLATVVTGQGYVGWDTEEFSAMVEWMRTYNCTVPERKKVRFYGLDLYRNAVGRKTVLAFVQRTAPELATSTDSLFRILAEQEGQWPGWDTTVVKDARAGLTALSTGLAARRASLRERVPAAEFDEVMHLVDVMQQGASMNGRSKAMGDNLIYLIDHDTLNTKFVMWAHNYHVGVTTGQQNSQSAGYYLRQRLGSAYYAVSLQLDHGSYITRVFPPPGEFKIGTHPPTDDVSLGWYLSRAGANQLFLDMRAVPRGSQVEQWLETPQVVRGANWAYSDPLRNVSRMNLYERYDGILFVAESTPTHPTANARDIVARKIGF